jgi:hypothetical protein
MGYQHMRTYALPNCTCATTQRDKGPSISSYRCSHTSQPPTTSPLSPPNDYARAYSRVANTSSATSVSVANRLSCRTSDISIRRSMSWPDQRPGEHVYTAGPKSCAFSLDRGHATVCSNPSVTMARDASLDWKCTTQPRLD